MATGLNTGVPNGSTALKVFNNDFFVWQYANDGTRNSIPAGQVIDANFIQGKINETDLSKRWYPIGKYYNVTPTDQTATSESFNDGSTRVTTLTPASFSGFLLSADTVSLDAINQLKCESIGVFSVDQCNVLVGVVDDSSGACSCDAVATHDPTEPLYPIPIQDGTLTALYNAATDTTTAKINVVYEYDKVARIGSWRVAASDINLLTVKGLIDVYGTEAAATTATELTVTLNTRYGAFDNPVKAVGWVLADFIINNLTTPAVVAVTAVTQTPDGTYKLEFAAQTPADVLEVTSAKIGYCLVPYTVTVP